MSENTNQTPILLISSKDKNVTDSYNNHKAVEVYVEQTNIPNPYNLADLVNITATDSTGTKNLINNINVNWDEVDFKRPGRYTVTVSCMDQSLNLALSSFIIHVVPVGPVRNKAPQKDKKKAKKQGKKADKHVKEALDSLSFSSILKWAGTLVVIGCVIWFFADMFI